MVMFKAVLAVFSVDGKVHSSASSVDRSVYSSASGVLY